jgi:hypothetical protein
LSASRPGRIIPGDRVRCTDFIDGLVVLRASLESAESRQISCTYRELNPVYSVLLSVSGPYIDWAIVMNLHLITK